MVWLSGAPLRPARAPPRPTSCHPPTTLAPPSGPRPLPWQVRRLQHDTEYTCWFALQKKVLRRSKGSLGHVQLRFSVHWSKPRRRLLEYPSPPATVELPLLSSPQHTAEQARGLIEFARFGLRPDTRYQWSTLDGHIKEVHSLRLTLGLGLGLSLSLSLTTHHSPLNPHPHQVLRLLEAVPRCVDTLEEVPHMCAADRLHVHLICNALERRGEEAA